MTDEPREVDLVQRRAMVSLDGALLLIDRAIAVGEARGVPVSVTVVDATMTLVAFARTDQATVHSIETSRREASTAASTRRATGWMDAELGAAIPAATGGSLTNIAGGSPIVVGGQTVGGLGVAGGTPSQDAETAQAALDRFGER